MQEIAKTESYEELKGNLLGKIGDINANVVKTYFQSLIESERTLTTIQSIGNLITILEERDYLNEDNLSILDDIFKYCLKLGLLDDTNVNEMKDDIGFYKKEFDCLSIDECQVCFEERHHAELVQLVPSAPQLSPTYLNNSHQATAPLEQSFFEKQLRTEIDAIIWYISEHIGADWRPFASFLGVQEKKIQALYNKYGKQNSVCAAYEALSEWKKHSHRKPEDEKKQILIKCLQRDSVYFHSTIAEGISNGEHWR